MKKNKPHDQPVKPVTKRRLFLLKVVSVLIPFFILLLLESGLRIFHYGHAYNLFIEYPENKDYYILNPAASQKYFTDPKMATVGNREPFKKHKDGQTYRIFILGESTTIGYPYFHNGSFHRWLQYRLMRNFPDRNFEIINLSLTAVNSYTVLGFAKELVQYEPDAVCIYTGQNEYYGTLGVGSTENMGSNPVLVHCLLTLRELRLVQLASNLYMSMKRLFGPNGRLTTESRMELMVADQQIPYGSKVYEKGIRQFQANMKETLKILDQHHIPVFLSNLVSNEKDLKPFVSFNPTGNKGKTFSKWYQAGITAFRQGVMEEAYTALKRASQLYPAHAACQYYLGQLALQQDDLKLAQQYFLQAKELDGLRFRAPEQLNRIIAQLCKQFTQVHLVDTKALFTAYSAQHIIGSDLILEHVHPNLFGYALMSDAFYRAMVKAKLSTVHQEKEISFAQLLHDMPIPITDSLAGQYKIARLKKSWPFNEALQADSLPVNTFEEKLAYAIANRQTDWYSANDRLFQYYIQQQRFEDARKIVAGLVLEYPMDATYYERAAMLSGRLNDREQLFFYLKKAFTLTPSFDKARYLFVNYLQADRPEEAIPYLDYAIGHNPSSFNLQPIKVAALKIIQLKSNYATDPTNLESLKQIAELYRKMDNAEGAAKYQKLMTLAGEHVK